jgi:hypothetical protein
LWSEAVPKFEGEIGIGGCKRCNKSILKSLDGLFGRIDAVSMWFNKLELASLFGDNFF